MDTNYVFQDNEFASNSTEEQVTLSVSQWYVLLSIASSNLSWNTPLSDTQEATLAEIIAAIDEVIS